MCLNIVMRTLPNLLYIFFTGYVAEGSLQDLGLKNFQFIYLFFLSADYRWLRSNSQ